MLTLWITVGEVLLLAGFLLGQQFPSDTVRRWLLHLGGKAKLAELLRGVCSGVWICRHRTDGMCTIAELVRDAEVIVLPDHEMVPDGAAVLFSERLAHQEPLGLYLGGLEGFLSMWSGKPPDPGDGVIDD